MNLSVQVLVLGRGRVAFGKLSMELLGSGLALGVAVHSVVVDGVVDAAVVQQVLFARLRSVLGDFCRQVCLQVVWARLVRRVRLLFVPVEGHVARVAVLRVEGIVVLATPVVVVASLPHLEFVFILRVAGGESLLILQHLILLRDDVREGVGVDGVQVAQVSVAVRLVVDGVALVPEGVLDVVVEFVALVHVLVVRQVRQQLLDVGALLGHLALVLRLRLGRLEEVLGEVLNRRIVGVGVDDPLVFPKT